MALATMPPASAPPSPSGRVDCRRSWLRRLFPPSDGLAWFAITGWTVEMFLLAVGRPNLYGTGWATTRFGIAFVLWFWLVVTWSLQAWGTRWFSDQALRSTRAVQYGVWWSTAMVGSTLSLFYLASWILFLRTGRFANIETGRFLLFNFAHLQDYLVAAEPAQLGLALVVWLGLLVGIPYGLRWCMRRQAIAESTPPRHSLALLCALSLVVWSLWNHLPAEPSVLRQSARQHALKHGLHPAFSLYISQVEAQQQGRIAADIDVSQLTLRLRSAPEASPTIADPITAQSPSIIFVAVESLRFDAIHQTHQGQEVLPHINALARQGVEWRRAYSESTHSDYADICLVSSLYPLRTPRHHYYGPSDPWPKTCIYDVLKPRGYATAIISSQNESWGGMSHFLASPQLDRFYHPETSRAETIYSQQDIAFTRELRLGGLVAGKFPDEHTADVAITWIEQQVRDKRPFFLSMNLQSSHFPYLMPVEIPRPFQPCTFDASISFVDYPMNATETVRNAYFNAIHECDRQIGRLVEALRACGQLDNTILVITGENGEAFHECGTVTHAREPVEPAIHIACVMHAPHRLSPRVEDYPFEHVDLVPTVLALSGIASHPNFQGIDALAATRPAADERLTFCHVLSSLAEADSVTLGGQWKLTVDRRSGRATLFDVLHDPGETRDQARSETALATRLRHVLNAWRHRQLAYYHHPLYYLNYYPPAPPTWNAIDPQAPSAIH